MQQHLRNACGVKKGNTVINFGTKNVLFASGHKKCKIFLSCYSNVVRYDHKITFAKIFCKHKRQLRALNRRDKGNCIRALLSATETHLISQFSNLSQQAQMTLDKTCVAHCHINVTKIIVWWKCMMLYIYTVFTLRRILKTKYPNACLLLCLYWRIANENVK